MAINRDKKGPNTQFDFADLDTQRVRTVGNGSSRELPAPPVPQRLMKKGDAAAENYESLFGLQLGSSDYFTVAEKTLICPDESPVAVVKRIAHNDGIKTILKVQHERFVEAKEVILDGGALSVAFEFMLLSIAEFVGHPLMTELQLASILGQVVDGLVYLERNSLQHGQLKCSKILVDITGNAKIWGQEHCHASSDMRADIKALGTITIERYRVLQRKMAISASTNLSAGREGWTFWLKRSVLREYMPWQSTLCWPSLGQTTYCRAVLSREYLGKPRI